MGPFNKKKNIFYVLYIYIIMYCILFYFVLVPGLVGVIWLEL